MGRCRITRQPPYVLVYTSRTILTCAAQPGVVKYGSYEYDDGALYVGDWNQRGQKQGMGHLVLPDGTRYDGAFQNGLFAGLGIIAFSDGAR